MRFFQKFFSKTKDLEFVDTKRTAYLNYPIERACDVKLNTQKPQLDKYGKHLFPKCPGMIDYAQLGYIVPAHVDIHIMANKAGISYRIGSPDRGERGFENGRPMEPNIIDGVFNVEDGISLHPILFPLPWTIHAKKNISAIVTAPIYHANFLDDLHVIPGVVDYQNFHTINFICIPKRECEVHIKAGEPLLHVIPFHNVPISAGYGPGNEEQIDKTKNQIPGDDKQYYRKKLMFRKKYNIEKE